MNVDELLAQAWKAVESSGVPESLQPVALKEAIDFLRSDGSIDTPIRERKPSRADRGPKEHVVTGEAPTEDAFFERLAHESGVEERELRDVLQLTGDSKVHVTPPTRNLGSNLAEQARTVIALVASARGIGLGESPVSADAVRAELERKRCYQSNNFAAKHLGPLKGFNAGATRAEIVLTSKWVDEFKAAVAKLHGRDAEE